MSADAVARYFAVVQDCTAAAKLRATGKAQEGSEPKKGAWEKIKVHG